MSNRSPNVEDMSEAELDAWFAERLQQPQIDDDADDQDSERLSLGIAVLALMIVAIFGGNALLQLVGYAQ